MNTHVIFSQNSRKGIPEKNLIQAEAERIFDAVGDSLPPIKCSMSAGLKIDRRIDGLYVTTGTIKFRATGLSPDNLHRMKVALASTWADSEEPPFVQYLDLYRQDQVDYYADELFKALGIKPSVFKREVRSLIAVLENERVSLLEGRTPDTASELSDEEKTKALSFLKNPGLLQNISDSLKSIGIVGEEQNSLLLYLVATSRLLPVPVGAVISAPSAAGKSHLLNSLFSVFPSDAVYSYSCLSPKALLHHSGNLDRKILSVDSDSLSSCLSLLSGIINDQRVSSLLAQTDEKLNRKIAEELHSQCRTSVILSSKNPNSIPAAIRQSLLNISLDESVEQTTAIIKARLARLSVSAMKSSCEIERISRILQNAQRLLKPVDVFLPDELLLDTSIKLLMHRRSITAILSIAQSIALLHQYQRDVSKGFLLIERDDLQKAIALTNGTVQALPSEISAPAQKLLHVIENLVREKQKKNEEPEKAVPSWEFTRKELRPMLGWSESYLRLVIKELQKAEYIARVTGSQGAQYRYVLLVDESEIAEHRSSFAVTIKN